MKRGIILWLMLFSASSLFAQNQSKVAITDPASDLGHENTSGVEATYIDSVTVGGGTLMDGSAANNMVMPYYVEPDPLLNPGYAGTYDNTKLHSHWNWTMVSAPAGVVMHPAEFTGLSNTTDTLNQVFLEFGVNTGLFTLQVTETVPVIGCASAARTLQVRAIDVPTAATVSTNYAFCDGAGSIENPKFTVTGYPPFFLNIQREVVVTNADGTTTQIENVTLDSEYNTGVAANYTMTNTSGNTYQVELTNESLASNGGKITSLTYTIQGVNDRISRKSDREDASNHLYYDANGSFVFTAYPIPETGNIRSVANN